MSDPHVYTIQDLRGFVSGLSRQAEDNFLSVACELAVPSDDADTDAIVNGFIDDTRYDPRRRVEKQLALFVRDGLRTGWFSRAFHAGRIRGVYVLRGRCIGHDDHDTLVVLRSWSDYSLSLPELHTSIRVEIIGAKCH